MQLDRVAKYASILSASAAIIGLAFKVADQKSEIANVKDNSVPMVQVSLVGVTAVPEPGCAAPGALLVTERYRLDTEADLKAFIVAHRDMSGSYYLERADTASVLKADPAIQGWTYQYCAPPKYTQTFQVRFLEPTTGRASKLITVDVKL